MYLENKGASFVRVAARYKYFRDIKPSIIICLEIWVVVKYEKNEVLGHAQTCDGLYITFQRHGDRYIA